MQKSKSDKPITQPTGKFVISLDFELMWGVRDRKSIESYGKNIAAVKKVLPKMVSAFDKHQIKGTWATVGFLFAHNKQALTPFIPEHKPAYSDINLSPYANYLKGLESNESEDVYHFAASLIDILKQHPNQEVASHTFSHYYCLEPGQTEEDFEADIKAAIEIAKAQGVELHSLVFPRNQFNETYLKIINKHGIDCYRGNEKVWFQNAAKREDEGMLKRGVRLLDSYLNVSGHHCFSLEELSAQRPINIPASRFLRPFSSKLKLFESLRLKRILKGMTHAAKTNTVFHLWWHPHNFGSNQTENFKVLDRILNHYKKLNTLYSFESVSMNEIAKMVIEK